MRQLRLLLLTSVLTGLGALAGVLIGKPLGQRATSLIAMVGGTMALLGAIRLATAIGWLNPERRKGGSIGGLVGLGLAAPLAIMNTAQPLLLAVAAAIVGLGVLLGAGRGAAR